MTQKPQGYLSSPESLAAMQIQGVNIGIPDICAAVDASQTPAVVKATLFQEAVTRYEIMRGEHKALELNMLAQRDRVIELQKEAHEAMQAEIKKVTGGV